MNYQTHQQELDAYYKNQIGGRKIFWKDKYKPYLSLYRDRLIQRNVAIEAALPDRMTCALDLGCGQGDLLTLLAPRADKALGMDYSPVMVETAAANLAEFPNVSVSCSPAERLDLPDATLDAIILADVIEHLREPLVCLRECLRVLKPGGRVIITTPNARMENFWKRFDRILSAPFRLFGRRKASTGEVFEHLYTRPELTALVTDAGFNIREHRLKEFYPGAEGGGVFGRVLRLIARERHLREWLVEPVCRTIFCGIARMERFNNRQFLVL